jgi:tetratricopeptide (TPR) repeat protein
MMREARATDADVRGASVPYGAPYRWTGLGLALCAVGCSAGAPSPTGGTDDASARARFAAAFQEERYADALSLIDRELASAPADAELLTYRGTALAALKRYEQAVETLRRAEHGTPAMAVDRVTLYLRAVSLYQMRLYTRAQQVLDTLARSFPRSHIGERGQKLAMRIEAGLAERVSTKNLNWYLDRAIKANGVSRPALAIEYFEEYLLLADRLPDRSAPHGHDAHLGLGAAYLDIGAPAPAVAHLRQVPADHEGHRAGMLLALSLYGAGRRQDARAALRAVAAEAQNAAIREAAQRYLDTW